MNVCRETRLEWRKLLVPLDKSMRTGLISVLRGQMSVRQAALELARRVRVAGDHRRERKILDELASKPPGLRPEFQRLTASELLRHFRQRKRPSFLGGFEAAQESTVTWQERLFPEQAAQLTKLAHRIVQHRWCLLGFGEIDFGELLGWRRDPLSGRVWPLEYHADISLWHNDGSDMRVLWEVNRMGHLITLGQAYVLTGNERFAEEFFGQLDSWREQNPVGRGPNWSCAMEVALRTMNLLAAFTMFRDSAALTENTLSRLLTTFEQHGAHIQRNLEFSYLGTSNHYLSDVVGLLWLGITLPELSVANEWREWALLEMLREMDKQVLADGAHYEASTGYHRFVLELFLYSFILCKANEIQIEEKYSNKLHNMLRYTRGILRPDGLAPLVGDSDGGQLLPIVNHIAGDQAYLLALGAVVFNDATLKNQGSPLPEEVLWVLGEKGIRKFEGLQTADNSSRSLAFPETGSYVLRHGDLYLFFNASNIGRNGRGSHGHNDSLSIEVSACGRPFIVDPGSYVYTADLRERQLFRSTAYHSTIQIADAEQNTTNERLPFSIGNEAHPRILDWQTGTERDVVVGEHLGYERLPRPVRHRRAVFFYKSDRWWLIEDDLLGKGEQTIAVRFHFDSGLELTVRDESIVSACDKMTGARLLVCSKDLRLKPEFEPQFTSRHYGAKTPSISVCWLMRTSMPRKLSWVLLPVCAGEDEEERLKLVQSQVSKVQRSGSARVIAV